MSLTSIKRAGLLVGVAVLLTTAITPPAQAALTTAEGTAASCTIESAKVHSTEPKMKIEMAVMKNRLRP